MIPFKDYTKLKDRAAKLGLPFDKETLKKYVKLVQCFNEDIIEEHNKLKIKSNEGRLPFGHVAIKKSDFKSHIDTCKQVLSEIDTIMRSRESHDRGRAVAKSVNKLDNSVFSISLIALNKISTDEDKADAEANLLNAFYAKQEEFIIKAAMDETKRRNIQFVLDLGSNMGGVVNYNKKESRFTFIQYTVNGYGKKIEL